MQWLIDIIKEWVDAQGYATEAWVNAQGYATEAWVNAQAYLTTSYVDRGDPSAWDFDKNDLIKDGGWHDLDISSIVPAGAVAVSLRTLIASPTVASWLQIRKKGNFYTLNVYETWNQVDALRLYSEGVCPLPPSRLLEYRIRNVSYNYVNIMIKGWFF